MPITYITRDNSGMHANSSAGPGPGPALMGADTLLGNDVYNKDGERFTARNQRRRSQLAAPFLPLQLKVNI
jgi:hypothetical protein